LFRPIAREPRYSPLFPYTTLFRSLVEIDQHRQRVGGPRLAPHRPRDDLGGLARDPARRRSAVETDRRADLAQLTRHDAAAKDLRSEEHTSELQSRFDLVCRLLLEK